MRSLGESLLFNAHGYSSISIGERTTFGGDEDKHMFNPGYVKRVVALPMV